MNSALNKCPVLSDRKRLLPELQNQLTAVLALSIYLYLMMNILVAKRKAILLIDGSDESKEAIDLIKHSTVEYVEYDIKKFEQTCCGGSPETRAPSIYATEGAFRGLEEIKQYVSLRGNLSVEVQPKNELRRNKE